MKYCLLSFICVIVSLSGYAQNNATLKTEPYSKEWRKADSLIEQGLPQSAEKIIRSVYAKARTAAQPVQMLKAQMYLLRTAESNDGADTAAINKARVEIAASSFPNNAIWHSITAQLYWNYYQQARWRILQRTALAGKAAENVQEWDAPQFFRIIAYHYQQSIKNEDALSSIRIDTYEPVIEPGANTRNLRPTLYDLLAFRALSFFENDEKDVPQAAFRFEIDNPAFLAPAAQFAKLSITAKDSTSLKAEAVRIYQRILTLHTANAAPDALIDADLHRIEFVYRDAVFPDKKALYEAALKHIVDKYPNNATASEAQYRLLASMMSTGLPPQPLNEEEEGDEQDNSIPGDPPKAGDLVRIKIELERLAQKFPGSEGSTHAAALAQSIALKSLGLTAEETVLPAEAGKILVSYKNVPESWVRIVKVDPEKFRRQQREERETFYKGLLAAASVQSFKVAMPGTQDYEQHSTEVKFDGLTVGAYAIIISAKNDFSTKNNALSYALIQSTNLAVIKLNGEDKQKRSGFVLHRKTGDALPYVSLAFYKQTYNNKTYNYDYTASPIVTTADDGSFRIPKSRESYYGYSAISGNDRFFSSEYFYANEYDGRGTPRVPTTRTFFFTDRSIYRPGQTVYFKGITVTTVADAKKSSVVVADATTVTFYDVNGQKISSQDLKTNEYGSFTGSFIAPQGVLTGQMRIENEHGTAYISVEEYKRPKFAVSFDTLKGSYGLNERITIKGFAKAYAGNNVDGATVKYTVRRQARWPYWYDWWRPMPQQSAQEISHGTVETDEAGAFTISFLTQPDKSVDSASLPIFTYSIHVDVTDAAGETRSGDQSLSAGYRSLQISAAIPQKATLKDVDTLNIRTENLNGVFVAAKTSVSIRPLQPPSTNPLRARLWAMPDQYAMSESDFRKAFPLDEYRRESKPQTWKEEASILERAFTTTSEGEVAIPSGIFTRGGWYVVVIKTKDKAGLPVEQKQYFQLWDASLASKPVTPLSTFNRSASLLPGGTAGVNVITTFDRINLVQIVSDMSAGNTLSQIIVKDGLYTWSKALTEADRGGLYLHYFTVKDNRVYAASESIAVPWSNKDLSVTWETHRDKLQPGAKETWTIKVSGPKSEKVAAEMVAGLYDASLDAFKPHYWSIYSLWASLNTSLSIQAAGGFGQANGNWISGFEAKSIAGYEKQYDMLIGFPSNENSYGFRNSYQREFRGNFKRGRGDAMGVAGGLSDMPYGRMKALGESHPAAPNIVMASATRSEEKSADKRDADTEPLYWLNPLDYQGKQQPKDIPLRKNLQETAFFYPQLKTDAEGNVRIEFTIPEALTEWKFMALAHTKDMQVGQLTGSIKTQKDLMVQPGLPRFFRQGDDMVIATKIANLSKGLLNGTAHLEIADAATGKSLNTQFRLTASDAAFSVKEGQSASATWTIHIPESRYEPVVVRITASAGAFTDGEENTLPVLTNRTLVTETIPLWMNGTGTKTFNFEKLTKSGDSKTLSQYGLTLEYTPNPAWYAVQALPYLMEYPYECAEQTFNRYYANALAAHIVDAAPRVKEIFKKWETEDTAALQSNLEKNEELKSALLEETPWVLEAKSETEQKHRIALLFQSYKLQKSLNSALRKLQDMQLPEGGFPWFKGDRSDLYITQYIVAGMGKLQKLGVKDNTGIGQQIISKAIPYMDRQIKREYEELLRNSTRMSDQHIGYSEVMYLYARSFTNEAVTSGAQTAWNYFRGQAQKYWPSFNPYMKGLIALSLNRSSDAATPKTILQSLKETSSYNEELGRYWKEMPNSWWWYEAPIEAQSALVEAFSEVGKDEQTVNELKRWLLKNKQTTAWHSTRATADACYALLIAGSDWLSATPEVTVQLGEFKIQNSKLKTQSGTGYFKVHYDGADIQPQMGNITLNVQQPSNNIQQRPTTSQMPSWGAVYWQYFEDFDKITSAATPLALKRQIFKEVATDRGQKLEELNNGNNLKVGDKVTIRVVLQSDRDMEYLHLKDARAACFEPIDVLSGYRYQDGLGYYQSTRDASSNFFISYLRKGTYVFTCSAHVTAKGNCSAGIATVQCMYAPEFAAHSEGVRVKVE